MRWEAKGNGDYRVFGPNFFANVHMTHRDGKWNCDVHFCNNVMVNAWDIAIWCEQNIQ
jgi:hypothetical protein